MGVVTSLIPSQPKYSKNPDDYWVHGINYWPGEAVPYGRWNELLSDYKAPKMPSTNVPPPHTVGSEDVCISIRDSKSRSAQSRSRSQKHRSSTLERLKLKKIGLLCGQRNVKQPDRDRGSNSETRDLSASVLFPKGRGHADKVSRVNEKTTEISLDEQMPTTSSENVSKGPNSLVCDSNLLNKPSEDAFPFNDQWKSGSYPFENLVLSGGGMKGYAYIGAIKALEEAGVMPNIKRFAGASAGAMCCAALSLGYTAQEICTCFFVDLDAAFNDQSCPCICGVPKLYTRYGIHPAKKFLDGFGLVIGAKTGGNNNITFKEHYEQFGKELCIVVCNLTKMTTEYCHYTTTPDWPINEAVRMSISIPLMYEPARWTVNGQVNYFIDGSTGDHFPIHAYDGPTVGPNLQAPINPKTIGFYVLSEKDTEHLMWYNIFGKEIPNKPLYMPDTTFARGQLKEEIKRRKRQQKNFSERTFMRQLEEFSRLSLQQLGMKHYEAPNKTHIKTTNVLDYILINLELLINAQVVCKLRPEDEQRTIPINVGYIESHSFILEPPDREFMLKQGHASARTFLHQYMEKHPQS